MLPKQPNSATYGPQFVAQEYTPPTINARPIWRISEDGDGYRLDRSSLYPTFEAAYDAMEQERRQ